jgi:dTDP-4-amino-4,6-dideoxygalactose transaminase
LGHPETLVEGRDVELFEAEFASSLGMPGTAVAFGAGRMALYALLSAYDVGPGDEVILPAFTCEVVPLAIRYRGATPVFADIEGASLNIDPSSVRTLITGRTRAIIAQHTFGVPCDYAKLAGIADKVGAALIEDCALAQGSKIGARVVGSLGNASFFSTDKTKLISTWTGGMAFCREPAVAAKLRALSDSTVRPTVGAVRNTIRQAAMANALLRREWYPIGNRIMALGYRTGFLALPREDRANFQKPPGYPSRLSNAQAALGRRQLAKLPQMLGRRRAMVARYIEALARKGIPVPPARAQSTLRFSVRLRNRDQFRRRWRRHFEAGNWFDSPALGWPYDVAQIGYRVGACPMAERVHREILNFPTLPRSPKEAEYLLAIMGSIQPEDWADG